jgi:GDSL-like Lipase/Acylhydrolase family
LGLLVVALVLAWVATACTSTGPMATRAPAGATARPTVMVALGGSETSNLDFRTDRRDTWTQLVLTQALPAAAVQVVVATGDVTAAQVVAQQLPQLAALHPGVVTIWAETADAAQATPAAIYQAELVQLVAGARRAGATRVLLLTPPPGPPSGPGGLATAVAAAATQSGATLVQLEDVGDRRSDAGQRAIAASVDAALRPSR